MRVSHVSLELGRTKLRLQPGILLCSSMLGLPGSFNRLFIFSQSSSLKQRMVRVATTGAQLWWLELCFCLWLVELCFYLWLVGLFLPVIGWIVFLIYDRLDVFLSVIGWIVFLSMLGWVCFYLRLVRLCWLDVFLSVIGWILFLPRLLLDNFDGWCLTLIWPSRFLETRISVPSTYSSVCLLRPSSAFERVIWLQYIGWFAIGTDRVIWLQYIGWFAMGTNSHMTTVYRMICYGNKQSYDYSI